MVKKKRRVKKKVVEMPVVVDDARELTVKEAKEEIKYRADKVLKTVSTAGWKDFIKPYIEEKILYYSNPQDYIQDSDTLEDIGLMFKVTEKVKQELTSIINDIEGWIIQAKELREQEKKGAKSV